jgi:hypothetical protein
LYELRNSKPVKISNQIIQHLFKCIKYIFAKNQDVDGMKKKLVALIPHQFGDHSKCQERFCGYIHRNLPYKAPLQDPLLRKSLDDDFAPSITKSASYVKLGSSQACEHADRETSLRVPKHIHYGESESLDFRVQRQPYLLMMVESTYQRYTCYMRSCLFRWQMFWFELSSHLRHPGIFPCTHIVLFTLLLIHLIDLLRPYRKNVSANVVKKNRVG